MTHVEELDRKDVIERAAPESRWKPPEQGCFKLNCDVAVGRNGMIGMGFVIRNADGDITLAGNKMMKAEGDSTLLEGYAMRYAMQMAKQYGSAITSVESDSKNLVEAVNGKQNPVGYCDTIISEIVNIAREIGCMRFEYIPRQANNIAHQAARNKEFISIRHTPSHLLVFLEKEK